MNLEIYKKGQGIWARRSAYGLLAILAAFGAWRWHATFNTPGEHVWANNVPLLGSITLYKVGALLVFLVALLLIHLFLNRPKATDMLIETEGEMRKVSWPSWREVKSATIVVVVVTFVMGLALFGFDKLLQRIFNLII